MDIKGALNKIAARQDLTGEEMRSVMNIIMSGEATPSQIGAFLMGMRVKGETVGEIAAAVSILREKMVPVTAPEGAIDIVGTGGADNIVVNVDRIANPSSLMVNGVTGQAAGHLIKIAARIEGGAGNDTIVAGDLGNDLLGGDGNDTLVGGKLDDWLFGDAGNDRLFAGAVANTNFVELTRHIDDLSYVATSDYVLVDDRTVIYNRTECEFSGIHTCFVADLYGVKQVGVRFGFNDKDELEYYMFRGDGKVVGQLAYLENFDEHGLRPMFARAGAAPQGTDDTSGW